MMRAATIFPSGHSRVANAPTLPAELPFTTAPRRRSPHSVRSARVTATSQAMAGVATIVAPRGSVLIPLSLSFVSGTLGAALGGFWWSMAAGAAGYIFGELLR